MKNKVIALLGVLGLILALGALTAPSASAAKANCGPTKIMKDSAEFNRGVVHVRFFYKVCQKKGVGRWVRFTDSAFMYENDVRPVCGPLDFFNGYRARIYFQDYEGRNFSMKFNLECERDGRGVQMKSMRNKPRLYIGPEIIPGFGKQPAKMHGTVWMKLWGDVDPDRAVSDLSSTRLN